MTAMAGCELCEQEGGIAVLRNDTLRVIRAVDADHPAFYRVIWNEHVAEMSDLSHVDRAHLMDAVLAVEHVLRTSLKPTKINLATLGNVVPHLHWHVIARFDWDSHFPQPIWGSRQRTPEPPAGQRLAVPLTELDDRVRRALNA